MMSSKPVDGTIDLKVGGMTCLDCSRHIGHALERVPGIAAASVDYRGARATVDMAAGVERTPALEHALVEAVERAGYTASVAAVAIGTASLPVNRGTADFDILIIGTGGAGVAAAIQVAGMGGKVAIAEGGTLGGTCVNIGCIPSKALIEAASRYHGARRGFPGIAPCEPALDWSAVVGAKDALVTDLRQAKYADVLASYPGLTRLVGHARLIASANGLTRVSVGNREYAVRKVIVATGTYPAAPALQGMDDVETLDSTTAMTLATLPTSLLVLGGGQVGVELGQMFARFGVQVSIVQRGPHLLPGEDPAVTEVLRAALEAEGLEIHTSTEAIGIAREGSDVVVRVRQGHLEGAMRATHVLVATGRQPNTRHIGLEDVGVVLSSRGYVQVDATMRTSAPNIYAAGDVTGGPAYVYVAAAGGRVAAENAMKSLAPTGTSSDDPREFDLSVVPSVTFSDPQVASVGLTEFAARAKGMHVDISVLDMAQVPRALVARDVRGIVKIVAEAGSGKILGVHAVAPNAGEFMGEAALAIRFGLTARDLSGTLHPYLTWAESLKLAAQGFGADISKLSCCA
ncbi:MAG: mercury(II) reductase [Polaromonas sp.]|nr:mercury(II) reductase [Gemmatimonadaceae bacterium]